MGGARLQGSYNRAALVYVTNQALDWLWQITTVTTDSTSLSLNPHYTPLLGDGKLICHHYPIKLENFLKFAQELNKG